MDKKLLMICLVKYGCFVGMDDETIYVSNTNDGQIENLCEVTAPESQDFLDCINAIFNKDFNMSDFDGR